MRMIESVAAGRNIVFFGDSITACNRQSTAPPLGDGFVMMFTARLNKEYPAEYRRVINSGINGETVQGLFSRVHRDVLAYDPDHVFIKIGINDAWNDLHHQGRITSGLVGYEKVYRELIAILLQEQPDMKLILITPYFIMNAGENPILQHMSKYGDAVKLIGLDHSLPVFDSQLVFFNACEQHPPEYWAQDHIHAIPAGHQLLANGLYEFISGIENI